MLCEKFFELNGCLMNTELKALGSKRRHHTPFKITGPNALEVFEIVAHIQSNAVISNPSANSHPNTGNLFDLTIGSLNPNSCGTKSTRLQTTTR
jgi:hypothetical protein